jgi:hypothetical protein
MRSKKILSLILSFCIFLSFLIPAEAATATEKAAALKTLTIFSSTTMDAQVKRFEAVVYVVRILGKEPYVKNNVNTYKNTKYSDVDSSLWYAPYAGYCDELGLIKDAQGGKFLPDKYITEKAFLILVLGSMGYTYKTDFTISNIYAKAYEAGLYTDISYKTKTADNTNFKKADVVNILYNALSKTKKGTKIKMIQNLVAEKVVSKETAISTGLLTDSVTTAVAQVTGMDQNNILVKLNEPILSLNADNIKLYKTGSPDKTLSVTIKTQGSDGTIILGTGTQEAFESYTLELVNIKDIEGNAAGLLTGKFEGIQGTEVKSEFFKINKVIPVSKDCINVYFTQPVNLNSQIASCYEIWSGESVFIKGSSQTLAVQPIAGADNGVSVYLKNTSFTKDTLYTLKINGSLLGAYGVKLGDGNGDNAKFKGVDTVNNSVSDNAASELGLTSISLLDNQTLRLEFNMELTPTYARQIINYYIADATNNQVVVKKAVLTSETGKNNRIILVNTTGTFNLAANYTVSIGYLADITKQYTIEEKQYSFTATYPGKTALYFDGITNIDGNTVKVKFNKVLDKESAESVVNYSITGINHTGYNAVPIRVLYNPTADPYSVTLYLPASAPLQKDKIYFVNAMGTLKDSLGNTLPSKISYVLTCSNASVTKPFIKEAVIIASDAIRVDFNKEIVLSEPAILTTNYILQYIDNGEAISKVPVSLSIINKTRLILRFDKLDQNIAYKLSLDTLQDYSGNTSGTGVGGTSSVNVASGK